MTQTTDAPITDRAGQVATAVVLQKAADLTKTWRRDDTESLDTFGQHLMGGAVLVCAEQLEAVLSPLPDSDAAVDAVVTQTLRRVAAPRNIPEHIKGEPGSAQHDAVMAYAQWMLDQTPTFEETR